MTGDRANLYNYKPCNNGPTIRFAGGELNPTLGLGDVKIGCLTVKGVLHVQDLKFNLFSMSASLLIRVISLRLKAMNVD